MTLRLNKYIINAHDAAAVLPGDADGTAMLLHRTSNKKGAGEKPSANKPAMQD